MFHRIPAATVFLLLTLLLVGRGATDPKQHPEPGPELKPIKGNGSATLKGALYLVGKEPDSAALNEQLLKEFARSTDRQEMLKGTDAEKSQYHWVVDRQTRGLKNVFVWLRPQDERTEFFDLSALVKQRKGYPAEVTLDMPRGAFLPHAVVLFPRHVDPKKPSTEWRKLPQNGGPPETGQVLLIKNTGSVNHNAQPQGDALRMQGVSGAAVAPGQQLKITRIQPYYKDPVLIKSNVHPWMKAVVWAFDHPFAAVTNDKGEYEIPNAPAGVKVRVIAWHEEAGFLNGGEKGEEITLKEGENEKDFLAKYRR
jgi:hypothetical protein